MVAAAILFILGTSFSLRIVSLVDNLECAGIRCRGVIRHLAARPRVTNIDSRRDRPVSPPVRTASNPRVSDGPASYGGDYSHYRGPVDAVQRRLRVNFPTCNTFHEIGISCWAPDDAECCGDAGSDAFYHASGGVRDVWMLRRVSAGTDEKAALKTLRWNKDFTQKMYEMHMVDAFAMERLTKSKHVVSAFGLCGQSVLTETAERLVGGSLLGPPSSALAQGVEAATGLADVHAAGKEEDFVIVHRDVTPANFVVGADGHVKMNDFNAGKILFWERGRNESPTGFVHHDCTKYRSPEECANNDNLDHRLDVYSLGHVLFYLLTGMQPYRNLRMKDQPYGEFTKEQLHQIVVTKRLVPSDGLMKHKNSTDPAISAMMKAIAGCYTFDREDRPESKEIATILTQALPKYTASTN